MNTGIVKWYYKQKGFGFILDDNSNQEIFFHYKDLLYNDIEQEDKVKYKIIETKYGKQAVSIKKEKN